MDGGLTGFIAQTRSAQTAPIDVLRESRIVIDGLHYLARCAAVVSEGYPRFDAQQQQQQQPPREEGLLAGCGGPASLVYQIVLEEIAALKKYEIRPLFVLPGLAIESSLGETVRQRLAKEEFAAAERSQGWAIYNGDNVDEVARHWAFTTPFLLPDLVRGLVKLLKRNDVPFLQAPFSARAQMAYLLQHPKSFAHAIWGRADQLVYQGVGQVITHFDFQTKTFEFVKKVDVLRTVQLNEDQFVDTCILSGTEANDVHPVLSGLALYSFLDARFAVSQFRSGYTALVAQKPNMPPTRPALIDQFCRTRAALRFHLVLTRKGLVKPLPIALQECQAQPDLELPPPAPVTAADVPSDLEQIFYKRLPDELFLYLGKTLTGTPPSVVQHLVSGVIYEDRPLCNGEIAQYRTFLETTILGIKAVSLALLASALHSYWQERPIKVVYWYDPETQRPIPRFGSNDALLKRAMSWQMSSRVIQDELDRQKSSTIDIALSLNVTVNEKSAARTILPNALSSQVSLDKRDEIRATVICRLLELRGLFNENHSHLPFAAALHEALKATRLNDRSQEPLYLAFELVRYGMLSGERYSIVYGGGPTTGSEDTDRHCLLVMRVLSLVPATLKTNRGYDGPLSKELLAFNSIASALTKALRSLIEAITLNFLLVGPVKKRARDDFVDLAQALPFKEVPSTVTGVLGKAYFDACDELRRNRDESDPQAQNPAPTDDEKAQIWEYFESPFGSLATPKVDLEKGFRLWDALVVGVKKLCDLGGTTLETFDAFKEANLWLSNYR